MKPQANAHYADRLTASASSAQERNRWPKKRRRFIIAHMDEGRKRRNRVMRLKGYEDAINAEVAKVFIESCMEVPTSFSKRSLEVQRK